MTLPARLLAKSPARDREPVTLEAHSLAVERAAIALFAGTPWGATFRRFFRPPAAGELGALAYLHLRLACLLHDLGKANADFQAAVEGRGEQTFRHEHVSAVILHLAPVRSWLERAGIDASAITAAVLSHHIKVSQQQGRFLWCQPATARSSVAAWLNHPEVARLLARAAALVANEPAPALPPGAFQPAGSWSEPFTAGLRAAATLQQGDPHRPGPTRLRRRAEGGPGGRGCHRIGPPPRGGIAGVLARRARLPPAIAADGIERAVVRHAGRPSSSERAAPSPCTLSRPASRLVAAGCCSSPDAPRERRSPRGAGRRSARPRSRSAAWCSSTRPAPPPRRASATTWPGPPTTRRCSSPAPRATSSRRWRSIPPTRSRGGR